MSPLLKAGGGFGIEKKHAIIASLSARVGSIGDNGLGGWHSYRASKTALNQCERNIFTVNPIPFSIWQPLVSCDFTCPIFVSLTSS